MPTSSDWEDKRTDLKDSVHFTTRETYFHFPLSLVSPHPESLYPFFPQKEIPSLFQKGPEGREMNAGIRLAYSRMKMGLDF